MNPNPQPARMPRRRDRRWYTLGIIGIAVGLLAAVGVAGVEQFRERSARMQ